MLANIQTQSKVITYEACIIQMYFFLVFGYLDNFLLTVMANDHYVAICHPLHYTVTMSPHLCALLTLVSRSLSVLVSHLHSLMVLHLLFSPHMETLNFFCEFAAVLKSACLDALSNCIMLYSVTGLLGIPPLAGILFSYTKIISSILNISSVEGKYKAFCVLWVSPSHFLILWDRIRSVSQFSPSSSEQTIASVRYTMVIPMLNLFIYSLRNRDMSRALRKLASRSFLSL
ncbi:olfactory receptor-like protein OLF4 [Oryx dammah]|uniref:olfactory receptor-like protein OLF4 n=1 Tax=Oryx dammah TaxID=59534 RepID=UPI001A9AC3A4|nr:olfactory receptor-like protein OLF4 [Oryx dammah]